MSGTLINIKTSEVEAQRVGYISMSYADITDSSVNYDFAAGSKCEVAGALYEFTADEDGDSTSVIAGYSVGDYFYFKIVPNSGTCTIVATKTRPIWDDAKQGYYGTGASATHRYIGSAVVSSAAQIFCRKIFTSRDFSITHSNQFGGISLVTDKSTTGSTHLGDDKSIEFDYLTHLTGYTRRDSVTNMVKSVFVCNPVGTDQYGDSWESNFYTDVAMLNKGRWTYAVENTYISDTSPTNATVYTAVSPSMTRSTDGENALIVHGNFARVTDTDSNLTQYNTVMIKRKSSKAFYVYSSPTAQTLSVANLPYKRDTITSTQTTTTFCKNIIWVW